MKTVVLVGPPLEEQTLYGPFDSHDEAAEWADDQKFDYSYIVTLHDPASVDSDASEVEEPTFNFGKYRGQKIAAVMQRNPGYIVWVYNNVANHGGLTEEQYRKAGGAPLPKPPSAWTPPSPRSAPAARDFGDDFADDDIPF